MSRILTDESGGERSALRPLANGKLVEAGKLFFGLVVAALVAYFTALNTIEQRVTRVETMEETHFQEVLRRLDRMENKIDKIEDRK